MDIFLAADLVARLAQTCWPRLKVILAERYTTTLIALARCFQSLAREKGCDGYGPWSFIFASGGRDASIIHRASVHVCLDKHQRCVKIAWPYLHVQKGFMLVQACEPGSSQACTPHRLAMRTLHCLFFHRGCGCRAKVFSCMGCSAMLII